MQPICDRLQFAWLRTGQEWALASKRKPFWWKRTFRKMVFCSRVAESHRLSQYDRTHFPEGDGSLKDPKIYTHINVNTHRHTFTQLCWETLAFCEQQGSLNRTSVNASTHCNNWHTVSQLSVCLTSRERTINLISTSNKSQRCMRTKAETIKHAHTVNETFPCTTLHPSMCVNYNNDVQDNTNEKSFKNLVQKQHLTCKYMPSS